MAENARPSRLLTERQEMALLIADGFGVTQTAERSMPSRAGRGLAEKYREAEGGVSHVYWRLTEAGRTEAARIRRERTAAEAEGRAGCARGDHDERTAANNPYVTRIGGRDLVPGTRYCQRCKSELSLHAAGPNPAARHADAGRVPGYPALVAAEIGGSQVSRR